jgi:hypothetical protein
MEAKTMTKSVFTTWEDSFAARWKHEPVKIGHELQKSPLFTMDGLADLIDRYPREHYALVYMGAQGERRFWREGDLGGMRGKDVIRHIESGRMWLNLRNVMRVDPRYMSICEGIFADMEARIPNLDTFNHGLGILISSPKAQVYYHADLPGQSLWQIHGEKRVFLYPPKAPFLTPRQLEDIALFQVEVDMAYDPAYDASAEVHDLKAGEMLHWPLNAPHRVENHDCLNVSMTIEYWTEEIRRRQMVNLANGILRHKIGLSPGSRATEGIGFYAKAILQKALRDTQWVKGERKARRPIDFRLDPDVAGGIIDLKAAE